MNICIAENLNLLRQKHGYTLEAIAEIISVSRQSVSKWEMGETYPDLTNCMKLASLYQISLDELVSKPLKDAVSRDFVPKGDYICGLVDISDDGSVLIPASVREMFELAPGDTVMLLADRKRGIGLVKCSYFGEGKNEGA